MHRLASSIHNDLSFWFIRLLYDQQLKNARTLHTHASLAVVLSLISMFFKHHECCKPAFISTPLLLNTITRHACTPLHLHTCWHSALIFCYWINFRWITFHRNPALFFWIFRLNLSWQKMMKILHLYFHSLSSSITTPNTERIFKTACSYLMVVWI